MRQPIQLRQAAQKAQPAPDPAAPAAPAQPAPVSFATDIMPIFKQFQGPMMWRFDLTSYEAVMANAATSLRFLRRGRRSSLAARVASGSSMIFSFFESEQQSPPFEGQIDPRPRYLGYAMRSMKRIVLSLEKKSSSSLYLDVPKAIAVRLARRSGCGATSAEVGRSGRG